MRMSAIIGALLASVAGCAVGAGNVDLSEPQERRQGYVKVPFNSRKYNYVRTYEQTHSKGRPLKNGPRSVTVYTLAPSGRY